MNEPNESKVANLLAGLSNLPSKDIEGKFEVLEECIAELQKQIEALQKKLDDHENLAPSMAHAEEERTSLVDICDSCGEGGE